MYFVAPLTSPPSQQPGGGGAAPGGVPAAGVAGGPPLCVPLPAPAAPRRGRPAPPPRRQGRLHPDRHGQGRCQRPPPPQPSADSEGFNGVLAPMCDGPNRSHPTSHGSGSFPFLLGIWCLFSKKVPAQWPPRQRRVRAQTPAQPPLPLSERPAWLRQTPRAAVLLVPLTGGRHPVWVVTRPLCAPPTSGEEHGGNQIPPTDLLPKYRFRSTQTDIRTSRRTDQPSD